MTPTQGPTIGERLDRHVIVVVVGLIAGLITIGGFLASGLRNSGNPDPTTAAETTATTPEPAEPSEPEPSESEDGEATTTTTRPTTTTSTDPPGPVTSGSAPPEPATVTLAELSPNESRGRIEVGIASLAGVNYPNSLQHEFINCTPNCTWTIEYNLRREWKLLRATLGVPDQAAAGSTVTFSIRLDGNLVQSYVLTRGETLDIELPVDNALFLVLEVTDGNADEYAAWGNPQLLSEAGAATGPVTSGSAPPEPATVTLAELSPNESRGRIEVGIASLAGVNYPNSLQHEFINCTPNCTWTIEYNLRREWKLLRATLGVPDQAAAGSTVTFSIRLDGNLVQSYVLTRGETLDIELPVDNALFLVLEVTDGNADEYAAWGNPQLQR